MNHKSWASQKSHLFTLAALLFVFLSAAAFGQYPPPPPPPNGPDNQAEEPPGYGEGGNGVNAGGNWTKNAVEDRMTGAHKTRYELAANSAPNSDDSAKVILYCSNGKLELADFHPGTRLARPNWPGFWGQPQMHVLVRVDGSHDTHNWNWIRGHFLAMDKGTTREMIGAQLFRVEFQTPGGPEIAEFSPSGLDLNEIGKSCGLKPKKP